MTVLDIDASPGEDAYAGRIRDRLLGMTEMFAAMNPYRATILVMAVRWSHEAGCWHYFVDGDEQPRMLTRDLGPGLNRDIVLAGIAVAERARRVELIGPDGVSVHRTVTRSI